MKTFSLTKKRGWLNYLTNAAANPWNANAIAFPAWANAPLPAQATVFPEPAHAAFTEPVAIGTMANMTLMATIAPITRRFVFISLP
jgi:hypothetical protein